MLQPHLILFLVFLVCNHCISESNSKSFTQVDFNIRVINMNVWGIKYSADRREERMKGIASFLRKSDYDLVFIQELWVFSDYKLLMSSFGSWHGTLHGTPGSLVCPAMASSEHSYIRRYVSPMDCNGLTILSKHPISHTDFLSFSQQVPRVPENLIRKGAVSVGLRVRQGGSHLKISAINSHFSGWFSPNENTYSHIRASQARELRKFARVQQSKADVVILAADLNSSPQSAAYRELSRSLTDSLVQLMGRNRAGLADFNTWGNHNNTWSGPSNPSAFRQRNRIDYIMYLSGPFVRVGVDTFRTIDSKIRLQGGGLCSLSDHSWIEASLNIVKYT